MKEIKRFETKQCDATVFDLEKEFLSHEAYAIVTFHRHNGKRVVRFGTAQQINAIIGAYCSPRIHFRLSPADDAPKTDFGGFMNVAEAAAAMNMTPEEYDEWANGPKWEPD